LIGFWEYQTSPCSSDIWYE